MWWGLLSHQQEGQRYRGRLIWGLALTKKRAENEPARSECIEKDKKEEKSPAATLVFTPPLSNFNRLTLSSSVTIYNLALSHMIYIKKQPSKLSLLIALFSCTKVQGMCVSVYVFCLLLWIYMFLLLLSLFFSIACSWSASVLFVALSSSSPSAHHIFAIHRWVLTNTTFQYVRTIQLMSRLHSTINAKIKFVNNFIQSKTEVL